MSMLSDTAISLARMAQLLLQRRQAALVGRDPSGGWRHRYTKGVLVTPTVRGVSWKAAEAQTQDIFFHRYLPGPGDVVLEIGAGCGTETVFLAERVGVNGRVIAVEAHPWTFELLCRTVADNRLGNVTPVHLAVTDHRGAASISDRTSGENILNSVLGDDGGHVVASATIDDLMAQQEVRQVDLLKMNIEGAEKLAVRGMSASAHMIHNAAVSCHDFLADRTGDEAYRTRAFVREALEQFGFDVQTRPLDPRPWARDYLYAKR
jgi:FkbM family methyltransferase